MFFGRKLTKLGSLGRMVALVLSLLLAGTQSATAQMLPVKRLTAGMHVITAEIAANDAARTKGLMFRESLEPNHGMLFVFERANVQCFWMKNTKIPLSIAFIKADGIITNIANMAPMTENSHCSTEPVLYTLEMEEGWFAKHGVSAGKSIGGL